MPTKLTLFSIVPYLSSGGLGMKQRSVIAIAIVLAIAVVSVAGYIYAYHVSQSESEIARESIEYLTEALKNSVKASLKIYKNGELVYYNPNDPITKHWAGLLVNTFLGCHALGCYQTVVFKEGTSGAYRLGTTDVIEVKLAIGNGTTPASFEDYTLENEIASVELTSADIAVIETEASFEVYLRYAFPIDTDVNISEAGVYLYARDWERLDKGILAWYHLLIVRDTFTPIAATAGDSIAVEYAFVFDVSSPPFTKTFWKLVAFYGLGLKGTGIDLGVSLDTVYYVPTIHVAYVLEPITWDPDIVDIASVSSKWTPRLWLVSISESQILVKGFVAQRNAAATYDVYGIAFYIYDNTDRLIALIPLDNVVTVDWSKGFYVELGFSIA